MIVVTLLAVPCDYVGWQAKIVRAHQAVLERVKHAGGYYMEEAPTDPEHDGYGWAGRYEPPLIRRWLGEPPVHMITLPFGFSHIEEQEIAEMFLGAYISGGLL